MAGSEDCCSTPRFWASERLPSRRALALPLGVVLARVPFRGKAVARLLAGAPVLLPPYIVALAWVNVGSNRGLFGNAVAGLLSEWTYSLPAAIVVLSWCCIPLSMLATEVAMRRIDGRLEEAGLIVAPPSRVLRRITLPLIAPSVIAAALIIFVLAVSEFGVPGLLRVRVYTTEVFTAFAALYDFSRAIALAVPLLVVCVVVAAVAAALLGDRLVATRRSLGASPVVFDGWRRSATMAVVLVVATTVALPMLILVREALGSRSLAVAAGSINAIVNSLLLAAVGATVVVAVAVWLGYAQARASRGVRLAAQVVLVVLFAVPSTIVGVGLIGLWNRPGTVGALYGTDAMLVLAYLARFVPVAALIAGGNDADGLGVAGGGGRRERRRLAPDDAHASSCRSCESGLPPRGSSPSCWRSASWVRAFSWRRQVSRHCRFASTRSSPILRPPTWPCSRCCSRSSSSCRWRCSARPRPCARPVNTAAITLTDVTSDSVHTWRWTAYPSRCSGPAAVVLGPSGCGKTTLLRVIAGLEVPDSGEVLLNGTRCRAAVAACTAAPTKLGFVFQDLALWPHLTVQQNLDFVLGSTAVSRDEHSRRVQEALALVRSEQLAGGTLTNFQAANSSVSHSHARSFVSLACCCWTSPSRAWIRNCVQTCDRNSHGFARTQSDDGVRHA